MTQPTTTHGAGRILAAGTVGSPIAVDHLTKRFGTVLAVDDLSFTVAPGRVTGFLGPNGAGKTTTLRCLLGLVAPTSGTATIGGRPTTTSRPGAGGRRRARGTGSHPGRTARNHLRVLAPAGGIDERRSDEVLGMVGLEELGDRSVGGFSLGMRQRLRSPPPCSATRASSSSTSRRTVSTPRASPGCARSFATSRARGARSWCRATSSPRSSRPSTTW